MGTNDCHLRLQKLRESNQTLNMYGYNNWCQPWGNYGWSRPYGWNQYCNTNGWGMGGGNWW